MALNTKHIPVVAIFQDEIWGAYTLPKKETPELTNTSYEGLLLKCKKAGFKVVISLGLDDEDEVDFYKIEKIFCKKSFEDIYLDYFNDYLTIDKIAEHYGVSNDIMNRLINEGRDENFIAANNLKLFKYQSRSSCAIDRVIQSYDFIDHLPNSEQESIKELGNKIIEILENSKPQ